MILSNKNGSVSLRGGPNGSINSIFPTVFEGYDFLEIHNGAMAATVSEPGDVGIVITHLSDKPSGTPINSATTPLDHISVETTMYYQDKDPNPNKDSNYIGLEVKVNYVPVISAGSINTDNFVKIRGLSQKVGTAAPAMLSSTMPIALNLSDDGNIQVLMASITRSSADGPIKITATWKDCNSWDSVRTELSKASVENRIEDYNAMNLSNTIGHLTDVIAPIPTLEGEYVVR